MTVFLQQKRHRDIIHSHLFGEPSQVLNFSAVISAVIAQEIVSLAQSLSMEDVDIGVDGVEPLGGDVFVRAAQQAQVFQVRRSDLKLSPLGVGGVEPSAAEVAHLEGDGLIVNEGATF